MTSKTRSLLPRLRLAASGKNSVTFVGSATGTEKPQVVPWSTLHEEALHAAAVLQDHGIKPGDHIALLGLTSRPLVTAIQAVWLAGACVIMMPIPMRMNSISEFISQTRAHLHSGNAKMLLLSSDLAALYEPQEGDPAVMLLDELMPGPEELSSVTYRPVEDDPDRLAILQFTSGSTSAPKGVMLPHQAVCANIDAMDELVKLDLEDDVLVSWLPLYHDMGLIGILTTSMIKGCSLVLTAPQDFLNKPADWMRWMSNYQGTITAGPNFSYILATRALRRMKGSGEILDLSRIRMALNGAEPIDPDSVEKFVEAAARHGFRPGAEFCAFGMAEVTIAGTFPPLMRGMVCDSVDRAALENESRARPADPALPSTRRLPLLGSPVPGLQMRITDPETGLPLPPRKVGELQVRGASVTTGYYNRPDLTERLFDDGWLHTGDLGYFVTGPDGQTEELVICGRLKDVIIIAGRNIYPEDIERAAGTVEGVRKGNVIAFSTDSGRGKESVIIVAEVKEGSHAEIRKKIRYRVLGACGIKAKEIVLVRPGTLPKTSSGKLQRSLCRKQYLENKLTPAEE
ncbi:MAG TPA: fatty acyl-AMP ligase [Firmicutes bacterium]|nr:fatty acyl-AMP ligase [Bacillota bacterium]